MTSADNMKKYAADILEKIRFDLERAHSLQHDITYIITQKIKTSARKQLILYEQRLMKFYQILEDIKRFLLTPYHHIKLQEPQTLNIHRKMRMIMELHLNHLKDIKDKFKLYETFDEKINIFRKIPIMRICRPREIKSRDLEAKTKKLRFKETCV